MNIEAAFNRRMRVTRTSGGVGGCQGAIPGTPPDWKIFAKTTDFRPYEFEAPTEQKLDQLDDNS